jgi:polyribonucleotide nucleotidyltransferase
MSSQKFSTEIGGQKLEVEIGKLAQQAHGSCTVTYGETVVLATAVTSSSPS